MSDDGLVRMPLVAVLIRKFNLILWLEIRIKQIFNYETNTLGCALEIPIICNKYYLIIKHSLSSD